MNINIILTGKTSFNFVNDGFNEYMNRLKRFIRYEVKVLPELKNTKSLSVSEQKEREADMQMKAIEGKDCIILLDDKGKEMNSVEFAGFINSRMNAGVKVVTFVVGGPYGFSERIYMKAQYKISLSQLTFSHQLVRIIFAEQLYRAFTIIRKEPYHHE